jgi:hypothetical protein
VGASWVGFTVRLLLASAAVAAVSLLLRIVVGDTIAELVVDPGWIWSAVEVVLVGGGTVAVYLTTAGVFRLTEVTAVTHSLLSRVRR